jgi:predicted nucleotidyltransferase
VSKANNFKASGREVARLICVSAPAAHAVLKELYNQKILKLDIIGKQHIYALDGNSRIVEQILRPMFKRESSLKDEIKTWLIKQIRKAGITNSIVSVLLYGSFQRGEAGHTSDVDIAVIIKNKKNKERIENKFLDKISAEFNDYFKAHLDVYVKSRNEFRLKLRKHLPPVSSMIKSYFVIWGKEPLEI